MSDLVEFLRARLDEDEQAAHAAFGGQEDPENGWGTERTEEYRHTAITPHVGVIHEAVQAAHIARHDPARVLREVEAARQLVDQYERLLRAQQAHDAAVAELNADIEHEERTGQWAGAGEPGTRQRALRREADYLDAMRPVLEGLVNTRVAVYADHPEYDEERRP